MENLNKYITLNFLSILGYIFFLFILISLFILFPIAIHKDIALNENFPGNLAGLFIWVGEVILIFAVTGLIAIFLSLGEFVIYKIKNIAPILKISDKFQKMHSIYFRIGIFLSFLPLLVMCYVFFNP